MVNPNNFSGQQEGGNTTEWDSLANLEFKPVEMSMEGVSEIRTSSDPITAERKDLRIDVADGGGNEKRTSNLMLGYNERGVQVAEKYYSIEEFKDIALKNLEEDTEDVVCYVRADDAGKRFAEPREVVDDILKTVVGAGPEMELSDNDQFTNQDARSVEAFGPNGERQRGVFMLGNTELEMPNGTYVSAEVIEDALGNYLKGVESVSPDVAVNNTGTATVNTESFDNRAEIEQVQEEKHRVIKRIKEVSRKWVLPAVLAASMMITALAGFGGGRDVQAKDAQDARYALDSTKQVETQIEMDRDEAYEQMLEDTIFSLKTGDEISVPAGVEYHESSNYDSGGANKMGTFGEGLRDAGEYNLEYVSVVDKDGKIVDVEYEEGTELGEFVESVAEQQGVSVDDLNMMVHIGGPVSGWVNVGDIVNQNLDQSGSGSFMKEVVVDQSERIDGTQENFTGAVSFTNDDGEIVSVNLLDKDGSSLQPGDTAVGSDGREYKVNKLEFSSETDGQLGWELTDEAKLAMLASGAALALAALLGGDKKKKEMTNMTGRQIKALIQGVDDSYGEDENDDFARSVKELLSQKEIKQSGSPDEQLFKALVEQELTVDEITNLTKEG